MLYPVERSVPPGIVVLVAEEDVSDAVLVDQRQEGEGVPLKEEEPYRIDLRLPLPNPP